MHAQLQCMNFHVKAPLSQPSANHAAWFQLGSRRIRIIRIVIVMAYEQGCLAHSMICSVLTS